VVAAALAAVALAVPVTASAAAPNVVAEPSAYEFRPVAVDNFTGTTVRFRNLGDLAAELGPVEITGVPPFVFAPSRDSCSRRTLAPGASCSVDVFFRPPTTGSLP
jgi:hypothetical protein